MHSDGFVGTCIRDKNVYLDDPCLSENVSSYNKSTGYRKIPGDVCTGGVEATFEPQLYSCCESSFPIPFTFPTQAAAPQSSASTAVLGVMFGFALIAAVALVAVVVVLAL